MTDLHTDLFSIRRIVQHSNSEKEAKDAFHNMHGFVIPKHVAHRALNEEIETKFNKRKKSQASYREEIEARYTIVEAVLDAETIKQSMQLLKKNPKFKELKKYYDTIRKDLIDTSKLSPEEAGSIINYAIHK